MFSCSSFFLGLPSVASVPVSVVQIESFSAGRTSNPALTLCTFQTPTRQLSRRQTWESWKESTKLPPQNPLMNCVPIVCLTIREMTV